MRFVLGLAAVIAIAAPARADPDADSSRGTDKGTLGVGIILGEPTGITAKLYLKDDEAIQAAVGSAFIGGGLQVYVGPGVRLIDYANGRDNSSFAIGARIVGGLLFDFKEVPLDAFIEV